MKKFFAYILILIFTMVNFPQNCFSADKIQNAEISKIENDIFGFDYNNDELKNRIARLEKNIYGRESTGNLNSRIKKLTTDISSAVIGLETTPREDTFADSEDMIADSSVNYPVVDEIEMKLFNQTYKNRDFHTRIVTIERKLFGKIYDIDDYSTRMDRIKAEIFPERLAREKVFGYDNSDDSLSSNSLNGLDYSRFSSQMPYGQENYTRPYANYGDMVDNGYPNPQNLDDELAQLEYNTFGTEFSNEDTHSRIKRLNSANKAKKSSNRYDSAKFQQRMSTAMEIGAMLLMILAMVL